MAHRLLDAATAVGVSRALRVGGKGIKNHTISVELNDTDVTEISACIISLQGSNTDIANDSGLISSPTLAVGSTTDLIANGAFDYQIENVSYSKVAVVAGSAWNFIDGFSTHTITASKFGGYNVYINATGTVSMAGPTEGPQAYDTAALANAALDAIELIYLTSNGYIKIGKVLISNDGSLWTADTDDLTNASDVILASFINAPIYFFDIVSATLSGAQLAARGHAFSQADVGYKYVRVYLSTLTEAGEVTVRWEGTPSS